jgi:hypothetical protein
MWARSKQKSRTIGKSIYLTQLTKLQGNKGRC